MLHTWSYFHEGDQINDRDLNGAGPSLKNTDTVGASSKDSKISEGQKMPVGKFWSRELSQGFRDGLVHLEFNAMTGRRFINGEDFSLIIELNLKSPNVCEYAFYTLVSMMEMFMCAGPKKFVMPPVRMVSAIPSLSRSMLS